MALIFLSVILFKTYDIDKNIEWIRLEKLPIFTF